MALEINHRRGGMEGGRNLLEVGEIVCVAGGESGPSFGLEDSGDASPKGHVLISSHAPLDNSRGASPEILGTNELACAPPEPGGREEKLRFSPR